MTEPKPHLEPPAKRILCFGELLMRLDAGVGQRLESAGAFAAYPGGAEANVAVSLARLGVPSALATVLPDNAFGRRGLDVLQGAGVDVSSVRFRPGRMGLYFVEPGAARRPSQVLYDRAGSAFADNAASAFDWPAELDRSSGLHLSGVTPALGPVATEAALSAVSAAVAAGVPVSFDGNFRSRLWAGWNADPASTLRRCFETASLAFANDLDFALVLGQTFEHKDPARRGEAAAKAAFAAFPRLQRVCFTVRIQNAVDHHLLSAHLFTRSAAFETGPVHLGRVVDRIGGGDAFAAGVLAGYWRGLSDERSLAFGLSAAALKHSVEGDLNPFRWEDVDSAMRQDGFDIRR